MDEDLQELIEIYTRMNMWQRCAAYFGALWIAYKPANWFKFWLHWVGGFVILYAIDERIWSSLILGLALGLAAGYEWLDRKEPVGGSSTK